jgi:hypothetical protein
MYAFVATATPFLSPVRPFHYIMHYRLLPRSSLLLEYPEGVRRMFLRNIGTCMTYSRTLGPVWTPLRKSQISNCFVLINGIFLSYHWWRQKCKSHGVPDLRCTWRVVLVCSWGPSACSLETCGAELPGRRTSSISNRLQTEGWIFSPHIIHSVTRYTCVPG